ncbi:glycosyltransferase family 4 protein [Flavobacterium sp. Sr18]|uniref:glycosyltransferase family 4 protein n=1 Tax=Flavobacterium sp. Sr18 TaxID=935222 RepID=UPI0013E49F08|nr:glycosyltransferase family 4 protein [Flavobacterium sp. Sr18]QIH39499.1 glycosyltransferase family 4 protein [Flavobacterium sp. Sr18]
MRIAYILPSLVNTGPIVVVRNIVKNLIDKVDLIDVYYFDESPLTLHFDCNVFHISKKDIIDFDKYDIIHSHMLRPDIYLYKNRKKIRKAKIISTLHQDTFINLGHQYNSLVAFSVSNFWCYVQRHFDGVISISDQIKDKYNSLLSNKITTIYNGCSISVNPIVEDENVQLIKQCKEKGYKILGSYAYITKGKGLSQVIDALVQLPHYAYVIFGKGPYLEALKEQVSRLKLDERVVFLPYVKTPDVYLKYMDIYMMPSYSEGFGLAMVEAALARKSIVCSELPSFHEIFTEKEATFFELDDANSLIESIHIAYSEIEKKGALAYIKASSFFTAEIMAANHLLYYNKILTNKNVVKSV